MHSARRAPPAALLLPLDPGAGAPLYRQLYQSLRAAILGGALPPGGLLPSTRLLAAELGVSRNTVVLAFDQLRADVQGGKLPQISWIAAPEAFSEHSNWPSNYGAWYISQVLEALTSDPKVWAKTALFITYDENDGFFDHVVPPIPPASANQGLSTVDVSGDLFPGSAGVTAVSDTTNPSTRANDGSTTGIKLSGIAQTGSNIKLKVKA